MSELPDHIEQSIRARRLFRPGQRILVAVSGGADSMVLLHVLRELALKYHWKLTVAHLNHQLRGRSSAADERLVRRTARALKLPASVERAQVRELARAQKLSLEMAARAVRHDFLARTARQRRIQVIALAHHSDDQLELFFLRLLRGSGGEGLSGMKWRNPSPGDPAIELVHPLLEQPKAALIAFAAERGIRYREDASNAVLDFQRNRIRHELLPLLRKQYQPALGRTLARVMNIFGAEAEFVSEAGNAWLALWCKGGGQELKPGRSTSRNASGTKAFPLSPLNPLPSTRFDQLPLALQRRCVQLQLLRLGIVSDYELVEQLRVTADRPVTVGRGQAQGKARRKGGVAATCRVVRNQLGIVHLQVDAAAEFQGGSAALELTGRAGEVEFDGTGIRWRIHSRGPVIGAKGRPGRECFDADKIGGTVCLRHWRPGDRFQPIGMPHPVKLQDFLTNQKVPRAHRRQLIVATTANGEIFWVEGMRISERFKLTNPTIRCLQWWWKRP